MFWGQVLGQQCHDHDREVGAALYLSRFSYGTREDDNLQYTGVLLKAENNLLLKSNNIVHVW